MYIDSLFSMGIDYLIKGIHSIMGIDKEETDMYVKKDILKSGVFNGVANTTVCIAENVLDEFRATVGKHRPETGGMLACCSDLNKIDTWRFDQKSVNTSASYSYDVDEMSLQFKQWKEKGVRSVGFVHSHPATYKQPSYDDIATARTLMKFFKNDFFYLPIIISDRKGFFTMYFFVVRQVGLHLNVNLDYVQKATADGYEMVPFRAWEENYSIREVESYYKRVNGETDEAYHNTQHVVNSGREVQSVIKNPMASIQPISMANHYQMNKGAYALAVNGGNGVNYPITQFENGAVKMKDESRTTSEYFKRLEGVYPTKVLDKVVICVGTGGARTVLENMARNGFCNYILIDGDKISPSNIATQGVFISEMGKWKTEAIRSSILDINPNAKVICVNRFLDNEFSDEEFEVCLKNFRGKRPTDYLVLGCCDTFNGNKRSSELSLKFGLPYIGAGMYQQGLAAEVIFTYPGVTPSCPRCMLKSRYEAYEDGYKNDVTSAGCPTFATERLNTLIGFISIMMLMYKEAPNSPYNRMLDEVKDRNFVWVRMSPYLSSSDLGIGLFDRVLGTQETSRYTFFDETLWIPQHPDSPEHGEETCKLCGGVGDLRKLKYKWTDTRKING